MQSSTLLHCLARAGAGIWLGYLLVRQTWDGLAACPGRRNTHDCSWALSCCHYANFFRLWYTIFTHVHFGNQDNESPQVNSEESRFAVKQVLWVLDFGIVIEGLWVGPGMVENLGKHNDGLKWNNHIDKRSLLTFLRIFSNSSNY